MTTILRRVSTGTGSWLLRRAQSLARVALGGGTSTRTEIVDGYIVQGKKVAGLAQAVVMDTPAFLAFAGGYVDPAAVDTEKEGVVITPVLRGRDELHPTFHSPTLPTIDTLSGVSPIENGWTAETGVQAAPADARASFLSHAFKPFQRKFAVHGQFLVAPAPDPGDPTYQALYSTFGEMFFRFYAPGIVTDPLTPVAGGYSRDATAQARDLVGALSVGDGFTTASLGGPFYTQVIQADTVPPLVSGGFSDITSDYDAQAAAWATTCLLGPNDDDSYVMLTAMPTVSQLNDHDSFGVRRLGLAGFSFALPAVPTGDPSTNVDIGGSVYGFFDPLAFSVYSQPGLVAAVTNGRKAHYRNNRQHPAYMARVGTNLAAFMFRYSASRRDAATGAYGTVDDGWQHTVKAGLLSSVSGVTSVTDIVLPASDTDYTINQSYWYVHGLGMDSDARDLTAAELDANAGTAVYVGFHPGMYNNPSLSDPRIGIVVVTSAGVVTHDFSGLTFIPHASWVPGQFVGVLDELYQYPLIAIRQAMFDTVVYIGNGKWVFPCSVLANCSYSLVGDVRVFTEFDYSVAVYDINAGTVTVQGTVRLAQSDMGAAQIPGRIHCVRTETTERPAVLVASIGTAYSATSMNADGETYISYDSGATWELFAAFGHGRGAMYAGGYAHDFTDEPFRV